MTRAAGPAARGRSATRRKKTRREIAPWRGWYSQKRQGIPTVEQKWVRSSLRHLSERLKNPHTGLLRVRGNGGKERQMPLGATCLSHLRVYLKQMEPTTQRGLTSRKAGGDPLFGSKGKQQLTRNGVAMLFARFRQQAGISDEALSPQILRHSFAFRYLQTGGNPQGLQALMGYEGMAPVRHYLRWHDQWPREQMQKGTEEG